MAMASPLTAAEDLEFEIRRLLAARDLGNVRAGIVVLRLWNAKVVCACNADELFAVASNNKLFVTAAALHLLGPDYTFRTVAWTPGILERSGVLRGDVIVRGTGDPNLSGRFHPRPTSIFESWSMGLRRRGVRRIEGRILADDRAFDRQWVHPSWPQDQLSTWYCAPISALSFQDNCIDILVRPGKAQGLPLAVSVSPLTSYVTVRVSGKTASGRTRSALSLSRRPGTNEVDVEGEHPLGGAPCRESLSVHDPALYTVHVFREVLIENGIEVAGGPAVIDSPSPASEPPGLRLAEFSSNLLETLRVTNKRSQNFYAEQVLKTLGRERRGEGSWPAGLAVLADFLEGLGIPRGSYSQVDGCGLARENRFSPTQVVRLLAWMHDKPHGEAFRSTLACGGQDGTLAGRFLRPGLKGRIYSKTGSIRGVSALSGYLYGVTGTAYAFSILFNDFEGDGDRLKDLQEAICEQIMDWDRAMARIDR